jgi:hypothetical protein
MEMPLRKLQEIIVDYAQHIDKVGRNLTIQCSADYPYKGPVFAFQLNGDRLDFTDNTQVKVKLQDGREIMESLDYGRFDRPKRNKVKAAFLRFEHWQNRILENRDHAEPDGLERELEIINGKLLPLAVEMLKSTAESYSMPDPFRESGQDYWTHPLCGLSCRTGMLESGENVPAEIQLKVEELNDLIQEAERRVKRTRAVESHLDLSKPPETSRKIIRRLLQEIIVDCAGDMILAGQQKDTGPGAVSSGSSQYPPVAIVKDGTNPFPISISHKQEATDDLVILKTKTKNSGISQAAGNGDTNPRLNRLNERTDLHKTKSPQGGLLSAAERRKAVQAYIDEVLEKTGKRITKTDFWKSARYKTRTDFERWQRKDPKATKAANERFTRLLKEKPHLK